MSKKLLAASAAFVLAGASIGLAQSPAGFAIDPNAETNQVMAPSNTQPADPGAGSYPSARQPTDPQKLGVGQQRGRFEVMPRVVPAPVPPYRIR